MIFLGDLACPSERVSSFNDAVNLIDVFNNEIVVVNLESVILFDSEIKKDTLYSHKSLLDGLHKKTKKVIVSLANNHMFDYPEAIIRTKDYLEQKGIGVFGLSESNGDIKPYEFEDEDGEYAFFGHCWNLYSSTNPNKLNDIRIVDCDYKEFIETIHAYKELNPERKIYCFMHWNYDLEKLPFPMHVQLSHDLIDAGVSGVIGSHSHITQCVELYKNVPIVYCLGNFYLPSGIFFDRKLVYPEISKQTIGLRIKDDINDILCFETDKNEPVKYIRTISFSEYPALPGDSTESYKRIFRRERVKKFLVPVFKSYSGYMYELNRFWAICRIKLIKRILKIIRQ